MGFRQEKSDKRTWKKWLDKNQNYLIENCGIPLSVFETSWSWGYFFDHGEFSSVPESDYYDIDIEKLDEYQMKNLCLFLESEIKSDPSDCHVLNRLQYLLKRGQHAEQLI